MFDGDFQPDNQSQLIHRLYTELDKKNQEIRELKEEVERLKTEEEIEELEEEVEQLEQKAQQQEDSVADSEIREVAEQLTDLQQSMVCNLERGDYKSADDLASDIDSTADVIRHYYSVLKKKDLIETGLGKGARLDSKGLKVKDYIQDGETDDTPIRDLALSLEEKERKVLQLFSSTEWKSSKEVESDDIKRSTVKSKYDNLKEKNLLEAKTGRGAILTTKGENVKRFIRNEALEGTKEEDEEEFSDKIKSLYEENPDIKELSTSTRRKLQEYYLEQKDMSRSAEQTMNDLYQNSPNDNSAMNMIWRAYENNENINKHPSLSGRAKKFAVSKQQKKNFQGLEAVRISEKEYDNYEFIKVAIGKLFPAEGDVKQIGFKDFTSGEGGNFAGEDENEDIEAWENVYTDPTLQKALKYEFDAEDAEIRTEKEGTSIDERRTWKLVVDRR